MKMIKTYILIFIVTGFSLLGADCRGKKSNVHVDIDTSFNKVISNEEFMKINQNLKLFGITYEQLLKMTSASGKFSFFINRLPSMNIQVVYVAANGTETDGPQITSQTDQPCMTFCALNDTDAQRLKIYEYKNNTKGDSITSFTKDMGAFDIQYKGSEYTIRRFYSNDSRGLATSTHLIGVEIMNK